MSTLLFSENVQHKVQLLIIIRGNFLVRFRGSLEELLSSKKSQYLVFFMSSTTSRKKIKKEAIEVHLTDVTVNGIGVKLQLLSMLILKT